MSTFESSCVASTDAEFGLEMSGRIIQWLEQNDVEIRRDGRTLLLSPKNAVTEEMMEIVRAHAPDLVFLLASQDWHYLWASMPMDALTRRH